MLKIPDIPALYVQGATPESLASDSDLVTELESVVTLWGRHINSVIEIYLAKVSSLIYSLS